MNVWETTNKIFDATVITTIYIMLVLAMTTFSVPLTASSTCAGQDCTADMAITIGNSAPTVPWVQNFTVDLTGGGTKDITIAFNVSDENGYDDINMTGEATNISIARNQESRTNYTRCHTMMNTTTTTVFNCTITMQYYDTDGDWTITVWTADKQNDTASNTTVTLTVNALNQVDQDVTSIPWGSATINADDQEADDTMILTNQGNQNYSLINFTGYGASGATYGNDILAANFSMHNETGKTTTQLYIVNNTGVYNETHFPGLDEHGSSVTEEIFFYVDIGTVLADSYASDESWSIQVQTGPT